MLRFPNCKINIGLFVTRRREDGYHDLETLFYPFPLRDALEIVPAAETALHLTGASVAGRAEDNLVWKAWALLRQARPGQVPPVHIHLHKVIPSGAGLGGGSADGAFMLALLNDFFGLKFSDSELAACALQLGSDCPFFIYNTPQYASGRGEELSPVPVDLSDYTLQLICPDIHVSTAAAFRAIRPQPAEFDLRQLHTLPVGDWKDVVRNDFEQPVFALHPELAGLKDALYGQGALYASMSGSGSALYGIFPKGRHAEIDMAGDGRIFVI